MSFDRQDAEFLLARPEFRRFLMDVIQRAGIVSNNEAADGRTVRDYDLSWSAGRRSLGHEILLMVDEGQPDVLRAPDGAPTATIHAILSEAINPKEKPNAPRSDRDDDDYRDDDERDA